MLCVARFHRACVAGLRGTEKSMNPASNKVRNGNLGVPLQRASGYQDWLHFCHFTLSIFLFSFFLAKTVVKMMRATIVFWINRLIKSHSRVKIIYTISYILSVYLKNMIEKNGKKTYINLEEAKNFELPTFPPADKFKLTDFIEIESINIFFSFSFNFVKLKTNILNWSRWSNLYGKEFLYQKCIFCIVVFWLSTGCLDEDWNSLD